MVLTRGGRLNLHLSAGVRLSPCEKMAEDGIRPPDSKRPKLEAAGEADKWKVDANEVLRFHFLDPEQEPSLVDEGSSFPAGMCHQHFGPDEVFPWPQTCL